MSFTIDASVFVAAALEEDAFHAQSAEFLIEARVTGTVVYAPVLVLAEVAGVISRVRQDHSRGDVAVLRIENFPGLRLRIADGPFARRAARLASRHAISGADAHYLTVATEFGSSLITLDGELLALAGEVADVLTPREWLRRARK